MKTIQYLSPSSIAKYKDNPDEFYMNYLSDKAPPRFPQTEPMAVGSSFDAYVKSYLHQQLFGKSDPRFDFQTLFEAQVEPQVRDKALIAGKKCFDKYSETGALNDLMIMLSKASNTPRFEFDLRGVVDGHREGVQLQFGTVVLLGKPDVHFVSKEGVDVILDWKVNGFYSQASPTKGYIKLRPEGTRHKEAFVQWDRDIEVNVAHTLDQTREEWAAQLSIYGWLLGMKVGSRFVVAIDQLACRKDRDIRIAEHRAYVNDIFQHELFRKAQHLWDLCHSGYFFRELTLEESQKKCELLDNMAASMWSDDQADFAKML